jgi:hypothetical protein
MIKEFAARSPRVRIALVYAAGYLAGTLFAVLLGYLIRDAVRISTTIALGSSFGVLAIALAQHLGLVPTPEELNKPISLFGPGGIPGDDRK